MIDETSLSKTLDALNEAVFEGREPPLGERQRVARWIAARSLTFRWKA